MLASVKSEPSIEIGGMYISDTYFTFNSFETSFINNISLRCQIILQISTDHGIDTDWKTNYGHWDFTRFGFRVSFRRISYIARTPRFYFYIILDHFNEITAYKTLSFVLTSWTRHLPTAFSAQNWAPLTVFQSMIWFECHLLEFRFVPNLVNA